MTLWFVLALMTAAASFAVLWPLGRRTPLRAGSDVAVYRDQLDEIERDRAAGLIAGREAEAARIEVSRRLIAAADAETAAPAARGGRGRRAVAVAALAALPLGAAGLYLVTGSPHLAERPQAARMETPAAQSSVPELVARVEAHLANHPEDGRGWEVLAPVYMRMNRYEDAARARRNVVRLLGSTAPREADLGEALTGEAGGVVTAEAKAAFERALALDPAESKARFFLGLAAEQDGRPGDAARAWRELLAGAPADAPWTAFVRESLQRVEPGAPSPDAPRPGAPAARGPSAEDMAAAAALSPEQRAQMVRGMVERLAERLKGERGDVDGWLRLLRAYMVLGERDKALATAAEARAALADDAGKLRQVNDVLKELGLEG